MPEAAKMVEMTEAEAQSLQQAKALLDGLWNSKTTGAKFKRVLKEHNPNFSIPEIDIVDEAKKPIDEKLTAHEKTIEALQKRLDERDTKDKDDKEQRDLQSEIDTVKKKYSLTEDGLNKVIDRMKEKKSYDPEAAAAWVVAQQPKTEIARDSKLGLPGKMNLFGSSTKDDAWKDLHDTSDPYKHFDKEVTKIFEKPEDYIEMGGTL